MNFFALLVKPAYGQITNPVLDPALGAGGPEILGNLIGGLVGLLLVVGTIAAFIFLILGALRWITSGGDKAGLEAAREQILQAIVGLIILAASWAIMILISTFLGLGIFGAGDWSFQLPALTGSQQGTGNATNPQLQNPVCPVGKTCTCTSPNNCNLQKGTNLGNCIQGGIQCMLP